MNHFIWHFISNKALIIYILIFSVLSLLILNCSELHFSPWHCNQINGQDCTHYGNTKLLFKKPVDILITYENTEKIKQLNPNIVFNLNQFLQCLKPIDWKLGLISAIKQKNKKEEFGQLMSFEAHNASSSETYLTQYKDHYASLFSNTLSLNNNCTSPHFCVEGQLQPLSAIKSFMSTQSSSSFLRKKTPLINIIISSLGTQKKKLFSATPVSTQELTSFLKSNNYGMSNFTSLAILPANANTDCTKTSFTNKANTLSIMGQAYGIAAVEPITLITSTLIQDALRRFQNRKKNFELVEFAKSSGGEALNLCSPNFGKAMAYIVFQKLNIQDRFPEECKTLSIDKK